MKIVLDTLGGDLGYKEHVAGAIEALKLKEDFVDCYTQDKYKDKIYLSVLIDLDKLKASGKTFVGFTGDSGLFNFVIKSCETVETVDGELVYSEVAYV